MGGSLLSDAYKTILDDDVYVRFTFFMTMSRTLIIFFMIVNNLSSLLAFLFGESWSVVTIILDYFTRLLTDSGITAFFVVIFILVGLGYGLLYPIGEASMISYLHQEEKKSWSAFFQGLSRFFPMFEFASLNFGFSFLTLIFFIGRFYTLGVLDSFFIIGFLILWGASILGLAFAWAYVKFFIVIEKKDLSDAVSSSIRMSFSNVWTTLKYVLISYFLYVRFLLNIVLLIGIPLIIVAVLIMTKVIQEDWIDIFLYITFFIGLIVISYLNAIIESFMMVYWYTVYHRLKDQS